MLCLISPSIDYTQKALKNVIPNYFGTMRHIFGIVEYQWYEETVSTTLLELIHYFKTKIVLHSSQRTVAQIRQIFFPCELPQTLANTREHWQSSPRTDEQLAKKVFILIRF